LSNRISNMGNDQSSASTAEIITEAQPGGNKKIPWIPAAEDFFVLPNDNDCQTVSAPHSNQVSSTAEENLQNAAIQKSGPILDAVRVAALDSFPKLNPGVQTVGCVGGCKTYDPRCRYSKRKLLPWKKEEPKPEPMETRGRTMKLDKHHSMVLYTTTKDHAYNNPMSIGNEVKSNTTTHRNRNVMESKRNELKTESNNSNNNSREYRIRLLLKSEEEMRQEVSIKSKGRKNCFVDITIVCGIQIFVTRYDSLPIQLSSEDSKSSDYQSINSGYTKIMALDGMNFIKPTTIPEDKINQLISIFQEKVHFPLDEGEHESSEQSPVGQNHQGKKFYDLSGCLVGNLSDVYSALVPVGIGKQTFTPERLMNTVIDPVDDVICLDQENHVYVCDIGLSATQCDFIVDTTERCSRGNYSAYTYAKQTLGCRDHDELAVLCEWPVMRAYASIMTHLEKRYAKSHRDGVSTARQLVLDEREPHVVKYDTSKKERQKLDTHTDKSEWTFIIALCDGNGKDYDGGGTYLESIDATIHLQKGHALIFPGKQRHRGQKIIGGIRFLLVGFLVDKDELDKKESKKKNSE